ncbi:MAG: hypothetical protein HC925_01720 [Coleofasciculaceae cyanobacterium SM2_3_26]|nr:hypothetical protein [Coleofasciculaceae cyanobacterium SM2_3_26]
MAQVLALSSLSGSPRFTTSEKTEDIPADVRSLLLPRVAAEPKRVLQPLSEAAAKRYQSLWENLRRGV